jgi:hypothetical protein
VKTTTTMIATRSVPEIGIVAVQSRCAPEAEVYSDPRPGWRQVGPDTELATVVRSGGDATRVAEPRLDPLTELGIRADTIAEMDEAEARERRDRDEEHERAFWSQTDRVLARLDDPDGSRAREDREHMETIRVIEQAEAAPMRQALAEVDQAWGAWAPWR